MWHLLIGLGAVAALAATAPAAGATTTVGLALGTGANAGEALSIDASRRSNDVAITLSTARARGAVRTSFRVVDRRDRVAVEPAARRLGCRTRGRHTVVCRAFLSSFAFVSLGAGNDRLTVTGRGVPRPTASLGPAPDGLAGLPQDEGSEGSFLGWRIDGGPGNDRLSGSPYQDHFVGGTGSDVLRGRAGTDLFEQRGEPGADRIDGGFGHDALLWSSVTPVGVDLRSGRFTGGTVRSVDKVQGGAGDDVLVGTDGEELLQGSGGADVIAGLGGADLLVGDGVAAAPAAEDTIDGGAGDDLLDVSNKAFNPFGLSVVATDPGPRDRLHCGDGTDRVDTISSQTVPADCEGARFQDAANTVALRPAFRSDGMLVYDVPCPARNYYGRPVARCAGALVLTRLADGAALGSTAFAGAGGARTIVAVKPNAPVAGIGPVGVRIVGVFDDPPADDTVNRFDFGWALGL